MELKDHGGGGAFTVLDDTWKDFTIGHVFCPGNFVLQRPVLVLDGPRGTRRCPRKIGEIILGSGSACMEPLALAERVKKAAQEFDNMVATSTHGEALQSRGWVLDLREDEAMNG